MQCRDKKHGGDSGQAGGAELETAQIIFVATQIGLTVADFEHMTIGMIFDHIITYNNLNSGDETTAREANDDDMLAF